MRWKRCAVVAGFIHFSITQGLFPRTARAATPYTAVDAYRNPWSDALRESIARQENCFLFACLQEMEYFCKPFQQQRKT